MHISHCLHTMYYKYTHLCKYTCLVDPLFIHTYKYLVNLYIATKIIFIDIFMTCSTNGMSIHIPCIHDLCYLVGSFEIHMKYIHIHITHHMNICIHIYTHINIHTYTYIMLPTYTCICIDICIHGHTMLIHPYTWLGPFMCI